MSRKVALASDEFVRNLRSKVDLMVSFPVHFTRCLTICRSGIEGERHHTCYNKFVLIVEEVDI